MDMGARQSRLNKADCSEMEGLSINNTYCIRGQRVSKAASVRRPGCLADIRVADHVFSDEEQPLRTWPLFYVVGDKGSDDLRIYKAPKSARDMNYKSVIPKLKVY